MTGLKIEWEWQQADPVACLEHRATWARLQVCVNDQNVTRVWDHAANSVRAAVYLPLYPLAEWIASNWWALFHEWRSNGSDERHRLRSAGEGFAVPDLSFQPSDSHMELRWRRCRYPHAHVEFLPIGHAVVAKQQVERELRRFIENLIQRLEESGLPRTSLASEWQAVRDSESDPQVAEFCRAAAQFGQDPFSIADADAEMIVQASSQIPGEIRDDFAAAVPLAKVRPALEAVTRFYTHAGEARATARGLTIPSPSLQDAAASVVTNGTPWREGYDLARYVRAAIGREEATPPLESLRLHAGVIESQLEVFGESRIDGAVAPAATGGMVVGVRPRDRKESRRFALCRGICDALLSPGKSSLVTQVIHSERQQRNRAFAAEFLAPAEHIRARLSSRFVGPSDVESLAEEFRVSARVIEHQLINHQLADLVDIDR